MSPQRVEVLQLSGAEFGPVRLLDAQRTQDGATLWFGAHEAETAVLCNGKPLTIEPVPGGARAQVRGDGNVEVSIAGKIERLIAQPPTPEMLAGRNVLLAIRLMESVEATVEWLRYHVKAHGADAAVILDRRHVSDPIAPALSAAAAGIEGLDKVVVVHAPYPLGHRDLPAADHPWNAAAAPGKSRMKVPAPDPDLSPLRDSLIYNVLKSRLLNDARAVLNIDISDLLLPRDGAGVFDRAVAAKGYLSILGREAYPWRVPENRALRHADHAYVQFDRSARRKRWVVAPNAVPDAIWRITRIAGASSENDPAQFVQCMGLRHPGRSVSELVPKTALVKDTALVEMAREQFDHTPQLAPEVQPTQPPKSAGHVTVVTCMKNEGPFILEWLAHHRTIGIERFVVYSNDCDDGTDTLLDLLAARGLIEHRNNPYRATGQKPQHAAFHAAESEPLVKKADWLLTIDVDEFINIHTGDGHIRDLFAAVPDANMISMTWRLFGNADRHHFDDSPITSQFTRCAPKIARKPHQAWGFKTLYRRQGTFRKLGVHRPKGLVPQLKDHIHWVNGSGQPMPQTAYRNAWRSTMATYGYDLVTLNHYAVRNADSFLVKRDRGRVNHVDRDQGMIYWFRMNNNSVEDRSILARRDATQAELERLKSDPEIAAAHDTCVARHRSKIAELKDRPDYAAFYAELTSPRMEKLSRLHSHFGSGVFWSGPQVVPDEIVAKDPDEKFFFTVDPVGKGH